MLHSACGSSNTDSPGSNEHEPAGGEAGAQPGDGNGATDAGHGGSTPGGDGGAAGNAGDGGAAGDAGAAGTGCDDACLANRPPVWIIYGAYELYGVRSDRIGTMKPVDLSPAWTSDEEVYGLGNWSPDGSAVVLLTDFPILDPKGGPDFEGCRAYLLRFVDGSPTKPVKVAEHCNLRLDAFTWSPSGKALLFSDNDQLFAIDPATTQYAPPTQISLYGSSTQRSWFKSDDEIVYLTRDSQTSKIDAILAVRQGDAWERKTITSDLGLAANSVSEVIATSDRSQLYYPALSRAGMSLWSVQTKANSTQHQLAGPFQDLAFRLSPNDEQYLLAATDAQSHKTSIFGGAIASLADPPLIAEDLNLTASSSLGSVGGTWSNDSRHALAFEFEHGNTHPVLYEVGAAEPWHPLSDTSALSDAVSTWSPDSKALAIVRREEGSITAPSLFTSSGSKQRALAGSADAGPLDQIQFSPSGDFFVYGTNSGSPESPSFYYLDLRRGLDAAGEPTAVPNGYYYTVDLAGDGTRLVYRDDAECSLLDLAKGSAPKAVATGANADAWACSIQKLSQ